MIRFVNIFGVAICAFAAMWRCFFAARAAAPVVITAGAEWIPFENELEIAAGSALDFSAMRGTGAPVGKDGRVIANGAHFVFEKSPGVPRRFYGVNLCYGANFLPPRDAEKLVVRLARTGYNAIRLHHHDNGLVAGDPNATKINPRQMARIDALAAACIKNGIHITTDLFVSREVPWRAVGIERDGIIPMNTYKVLVAVHEGAFANYKEFARQFLSHVNPRTGRAYAKEPALAWIALVNEGNFGNYLNEIRSISEWRREWKTWLAAQREKHPAAFKNIPDELPDNYYAGTPATTALTLFLADAERKFVSRMKTFLRDELGCAALITDRSSWTNRAVDQLPRNELFDYVDDHFYVDHPNFVERPWRLPSRCDNRNPLRDNTLGARNVVFRRLLNKPFAITEYNYAGPGRFRGMGGIVTGAIAALQDWGGVWRFAYAHSRESAMNGGPMGYFDMANDPLSLAAERASICLFLRGDLAPKMETLVIVIPEDKAGVSGGKLPPNPMSDAPWARLAWDVKIGTVVVGKNERVAARAVADWTGVFPEIYTTGADTLRRRLGLEGKQQMPRENSVEIERGSGRFILRTPRTCGGFVESGAVDAGDLVFKLDGAAATVWVSALDGKDIRHSSRLLLTHLTDVQNTGIRYARPSLRTLLDWGGLPHLARAGRAHVSLALDRPGAFKVYALSTSGRRFFSVPCKVSTGIGVGAAGGRIEFVADIAIRPNAATFLYEIVRE